MVAQLSLALAFKKTEKKTETRPAVQETSVQ